MRRRTNMILYKYTSADYWETILRDHLIRFSQPSVLNDPFEMQAYYESLSLDPNVKEQLTEKNTGNNLVSLLEEALPKVPEDIRSMVDMDFLRKFSDIVAPFAVAAAPNILDNITSEIGQGVYLGLDQSAGVLSLTEKKDNLLMWAHYGQQHEGMVIGFDSNHPFFNQKLHPSDDFRHLRKVNYSFDRPTIRFSEYEDLLSVLLTKSNEWAYEDEWRMILPVEKADVVREHKDKQVYLFRFPPAAVAEIILGVRIPDETGKLITEFIRHNLTYKHLVVHQAKLDRQEYKLHFTKLLLNGGFRRRSRNDSN